MNSDNPTFPVLSDSEAAQVAAELTAAACAMLSCDDHSRAVVMARRVFLEQYKFLREGKWPAPAKSLAEDWNFD